jgi:long-chain-fatty-acid--CoA ligase ACSBG
MGCCQAKEPRKVAKLPPTFNEGTDHWPAYTQDLAQTVPTFDGSETKSEEKKFYTWDRNAVMPIRYAKTGLASKEESPAMTVTEVFKQAAKDHAEDIAMIQEDVPATCARGETPPKSKPREEWARKWTWSQYYQDCRKVGRALLSPTIQMARKDSVCIFGFNSPQWIMAALGATLAGGCSAGIYPTDTEQQVEYKAKHSAAVVAFIESPKKIQLFLDAAGNLPKLKAVVVWGPAKEEDLVKSGSVPVYSWDEFCALGADDLNSALDERETEQKPGSACSYIYTSGTTGRPKAVMVSHDNIIYLSRTVKKHLEDDTVFGTRGQERVISYLPLSHVAGMMLDIIMPLVSTAGNSNGFTTICFARPYDLKIGTIGDRLRAIQPSMFLGVPRVWEKMQDKILAMSKANPQTGFKLTVKDWAKESALINAQNSQLGGTGKYPPNKLCGLLGHDFFDKKVLSMVAARLGLDQCVFMGTAAAPIKQSTVDFFAAIGIELCEIYGMSESTGATTFSSPSAHQWGSIGWAIAGAEVKILNAYRDADGNLVKTIGKFLFTIML